MWSLKGCHFSDVVDSSANNNSVPLSFFLFLKNVFGKEKSLFWCLGTCIYLFIFNLLQVNRRRSVFSVEFESRDEGPNEAVGRGYYKPCWRNLDFTYLTATKLHSFDVFFVM